VVISLRAHSISRTVWATLTEQPFTGHVLAVFEHACSLAIPNGGVIALVLPEIGDGPLNIVVNASPTDLEIQKPGMPVRLTGPWLRIGTLEISLDNAKIWEPRPDWNALRAQLSNYKDRFRFLESSARRQAAEGSLLLPVAKGTPTPRPGPSTGSRLEQAAFQITRQAAEALHAGLDGDKSRLHWGVAQLAGLGRGLTPAGDDFLAGVMLWMWLAHPNPDRLCQQIVTIAAPRTTPLSASFLCAVAKGECSGWSGAPTGNCPAAGAGTRRHLRGRYAGRFSLDGAGI
jgi:hypothetical protein